MSSCQVSIDVNRQLVIVSETGNGISITNAAEVIATELVWQYDLNPSRLLYIEHYSEQQRPKPYGESSDLVTFSWNGRLASSPHWQHLSLEYTRFILGK